MKEEIRKRKTPLNPLILLALMHEKKMRESGLANQRRQPLGHLSTRQ